MQILSTEQIRAWDAFTIENEPVESIDLMERAAKKCAEWTLKNYAGSKFNIFCGKGNNGGDGLVIARLLSAAQAEVSVYILEFGFLGTADFQTNLARLHQTGVPIRYISSNELLPPMLPGTVVIDALLGTGLNRPLEGLTSDLVSHLNKSGNPIVSIDMPTGMYADRSSAGNPRIRATNTLSFQCYRLAFLIGENEDDLGHLDILDIGLHPAFPGLTEPAFELISQDMVAGIIRPRKQHSHKGTYGHAALVAGSRGMMGAAVLSARAILRSGAGKLTTHVTESGSAFIQTGCPESICRIEEGDTHILEMKDAAKYDVIAIGPGLGSYASHTELIRTILNTVTKSMVIDADGLNILSSSRDLQAMIPANTVLTPHPKEFTLLFGDTSNDFDKITLAIRKAHETGATIVLKGHHTFIATPGGKGYFNSTGNAGMATAGAGDVLTGIIAGILAQGYDSQHAAIAGVFLHGLAGDIAAQALSEPSLIASDLIKYLGKAFLKVQSSHQ
jgi:NAD(P)H-hydrate epimerase